MSLFLNPVKIEVKQAKPFLIKEGEKFVPSKRYTKLIYIRRGEGYFLSENKKYKIKNNHLYVFLHRQFVEGYIEKEVELYFVLVKINIFLKVDLIQYISGKTEYQIENPKQYSDLFTALFQEIDKEAPLETKKMALTLEIISPIEANEENIKKQKAISEFLPVLEYIHKNYAKKITIARLAKILHLNHNYFTTKFTRAFGMPPLKYLNKFKMEKAQKMLIETDMTLETIAFELGYFDFSHLSKAFKEYFNCSPGEFRDTYSL